MSMPDKRESIRIRHIKKEQLGDQLFFFDSSVWLFIFNQTLSRQSAAFDRQAPYVDFWNKITQAVTKPSESDPTESVVERPVVAISSLVVTETLNAHLRKGFKAYKDTLLRKQEMTAAQVEALDYKTDFRDKEPRYQTLFEQCQAEFAAASPYLKVVTGGKLDEEILDYLYAMSHKDDFNDNYYVSLCKRENFILVTDDKDFAVPGITVLTANPTLLKRSTSGVAIKNKPKMNLWRP
jgi:hypothetical protein